MEVNIFFTHLGLLLMYLSDRVLPKNLISIFHSAGWICLGIGIGVYVFKFRKKILYNYLNVSVSYIALILGLCFIEFRPFFHAFIQNASLNSIFLILGLSLCFLGLLRLWFVMSILKEENTQFQKYRILFSLKTAHIVFLSFVSFATINYAAFHENKKLDLSYFKSTHVGDATHEILTNLPEKLRIVAFFTPNHDVLNHLRYYLDELALKHKNVTIEYKDQVFDPVLAKNLGVSKNGALVFQYHEKTSEPILFEEELDAAKSSLKKLDKQVHDVLMEVTRNKRIVYFTSGHDERDIFMPENDFRSGLRDFVTLFEDFGFQAKYLNVSNGLSSKIPADASIVVIAGPKNKFLKEEIATLKQYLQRGGALWVLFDIDHAQLDADLADALGIEVSDALVAEKDYLVQIQDTPQTPYAFASIKASSHVSVRNLYENQSKYAVVFWGTSSLRFHKENHLFEHFEPILYTSSFAFLDKNHNAKQEMNIEASQELVLAAALELKKENNHKNSGKMMVFGDTDLISNTILRNPGNALLCMDTIRWLIGDEQDHGMIASEEDVPVVHRQDKDKMIFYTTSILVPSSFLFAGFLIVRKLRNKERK